MLAIDFTARTLLWLKSKIGGYAFGTWAIEHLFISFKPFAVSSPNYPRPYPHNLRKTEIIQVGEGLIVAIEFTAIDIGYDSTCYFDYVTIKNGDGTTLMEKTCGTSSWGFITGGQYIDSSLPAAVTSTSNTVEIYFHTDSSSSKSGWRLTWRAVTPGAQSSLRLSTSAWTLADLLAWYWRNWTTDKNYFELQSNCS